MDGEKIATAPKARDLSPGTGTPNSSLSSSTYIQVQPSHDDDDVPPHLSIGKRPFRLHEIFGLFGVAFSYALVFGTINTLVIPHEIERISQYRTSMWLGAIMGAGAISQLSSPAVGAWSDRVGKRMPFLMYGAAVTIVGILMFLVLKSLSSILLLFAAHVVTTVGLSMQYSILTALLSDCIPDEQIGKGSGVLAIMAILGSGFGYALFALELPLEYLYLTYILSTVLCLGFTVIFVPPNLDAALGVLTKQLRRFSATATFSEVVRHSLTLPSMTKHRDFSFACLGRCLFNVGVSGQVYLVYYYRDVVHIRQPLQMLSYVSVAVLVGSVLAALPAGILSDRIGKKPIIYASAATCILAIAMFMSTFSVPSHLLIGVVYGIGNVSYLSVDYALGVQALPRHEDETGALTLPIDPAKDLGLFAMSSTLGQLFGQILFGSVLDTFRVDAPNVATTTYTYFAFVAVYSLCAVAFVMSAVSVRYIQCVK